MEELIFLVEDAPEGGYVARALGESIFTEANDLKNCESRYAMPCVATSMKGKGRATFVFI